MKKLWLVGSAILLLIASPVAGGEWYGQFKPFTYSLKEAEIDPTKRAYASGAIETVPTQDKLQAANDLPVSGGSLTIGHRFDQTNSAGLTLTKFKSDSSVSSGIDTGMNIPSMDENYLASILMADYQRQSSANDYETDLISAELNYYRKMAPAWSFQGGLKYMYLGEDFISNSDSNLLSDNFAPRGLDSSSHFFGAQVGADFSLALSDKVSLSGFAKLGGFVQVNKTSTFLFDNEGNSLRYENSRTLSATVVDGKFSVDWMIGENMSLSAGYMGVFMAKVNTSAALANDQTAIGYQEQDTDNVLYHGPIVRFNIAW